MAAFLTNHILTILIFLPLLAAFLLALVPQERQSFIKMTTLVVALVESFLACFLYSQFLNTGSFEFTYGLSASDQTPWISLWNVYYRVGVDGVSLLLVLMSALSLFFGLLGTWNSVYKNVKMYCLCLLALLSGMIGVFCSLDLFLFYVFWEVMLIPMYFLIGIWGGENRVGAALKFFIYTMAGSVLMLIAILFLSFSAGQTFNILELYQVSWSTNQQIWLFAAFALAFAIKVPLFPFHTWLPHAHVQAPTLGSVILAAVLLKMGVYGFFRFAIPLFPEAVQFFQVPLMILSVIGVVYGALIAMVQTDMKKLIAYSSVSHMGIVMLGLISLNQTAVSGSLLQMVNHGVSTGALFLIVGMIYDRSHTREISDYSGLTKLMPLASFFFLVATFSSIGVPLTNGFVGEFLTLVGSFQVHPVLTTIAATGVILGAVYMLLLVYRVFFGPVKMTHGIENDLNKREVVVLVCFVFFIFSLGVRPQPFLSKINASAQQMLLIVENRLQDK